MNIKKIKVFFPIILFETYAILHILIKKGLFLYRAKTYQPYPYLVYNVLSYILFGILMGIFFARFKNNESKNFYIRLLVFNLFCLGTILKISLNSDVYFILILIGFFIVRILLTEKD